MTGFQSSLKILRQTFKFNSLKYAKTHENGSVHCIPLHVNIGMVYLCLTWAKLFPTQTRRCNFTLKTTENDLASQIAYICCFDLGSTARTFHLRCLAQTIVVSFSHQKRVSGLSLMGIQCSHVEDEGVASSSRLKL